MPSALSAESPGEAGLSHHLPCSDTPPPGWLLTIAQFLFLHGASAFSNFKNDELEIPSGHSFAQNPSSCPV